MTIENVTDSTAAIVRQPRCTALPNCQCNGCKYDEVDESYYDGPKRVEYVIYRAPSSCQ